MNTLADMRIDVVGEPISNSSSSAFGWIMHKYKTRTLQRVPTDASLPDDVNATP